MTILEISQRMALLADSHKECMILIGRLSKLGGVGTEAARVELAELIHQSLKDAEQELELLAVEAEEAEGEKGTLLTLKVHKLNEDLKIARLQYRKAQLSAKRNAEHSAKLEREALLNGSGARSPRRGNQKLSQQELILNASTDVTAALHRTHSLLSSELSRSQFASETLESSTAALKDLSQRYTAFDDILSSSKTLITDLVRKNKSDRWYYEKAIYLLLGTLVWLVIRRLLYGPMYLLFIMPVRIGWWGLGSVGAMIPGLGSTVIQDFPQAWSDQDPVVATQEATKVEIVGIPESLLTREPLGTEAVVDADTMVTAEPSSYLEKVGRIIDGEDSKVEVAVERNPKSRRMEYDPEEEARALHHHHHNNHNHNHHNHQHQQETETETKTEPQTEPQKTETETETETETASEPTPTPPNNPKSRNIQHPEPISEKDTQQQQEIEKETQPPGGTPKSRNMEYDPRQDDQGLAESVGRTALADMKTGKMEYRSDESNQYHSQQQLRQREDELEGGGGVGVHDEL